MEARSESHEFPSTRTYFWWNFWWFICCFALLWLQLFLFAFNQKIFDNFRLKFHQIWLLIMCFWITWIHSDGFRDCTGYISIACSVLYWHVLKTCKYSTGNKLMLFTFSYSKYPDKLKPMLWIIINLIHQIVWICLPKKLFFIKIWWCITELYTCTIGPRWHASQQNKNTQTDITCLVIKSTSPYMNIIQKKKKVS